MKNLPTMKLHVWRYVKHLKNEMGFSSPADAALTDALWSAASSCEMYSSSFLLTNFDCCGFV